jgi:hypothetical protein
MHRDVERVGRAIRGARGQRGIWDHMARTLGLYRATQRLRGLLALIRAVAAED